jgi:hypothetical protein
MVRDKKGTSTPLNKVARGAFGAQLDFWRQRIGADVADVLSCILINGKQTIEYPDFKPGEKVRVRVINGGASTSLDDFGVKTQYLFHQTAMTYQLSKQDIYWCLRNL